MLMLYSARLWGRRGGAGGLDWRHFGDGLGDDEDEKREEEDGEWEEEEGGDCGRRRMEGGGQR